MLPELAIGDWLFAEEIGDYTVCVGSTFNGFSQPTVYHYTTGVNWYVKIIILTISQSASTIYMQ